LENGSILEVLYISYSIMRDQRQKLPPRLALFLFTMALKGMEPVPNPQ